MKSKTQELTIALLGGLAIGATLALLNAPSSGKKTKKKIKKKIKHYGQVAEDIIAEGKTSWQSFKNTPIDEFQNLEAYLDHLVGTGKSKWEEVKKDLETSTEDFEVFLDSILSKGKKSWAEMNEDAQAPKDHV